MSIIRVLNEDVSNRIAAGEVIERPASIVKELLENSLDAGATRVHVLIERGGQSLVQVLDNGHGMDKEDALLCLEAHATSKIRDTSDIENIHTMGFRGEALPSIASVCKFTLRTCYKDDTEGTEIRVDGGHIKNVAAIGTAKGTSIACRNLFYNMPARRKFLRTMKTEESHIHEMVLMLALGHPTVGFELSFDGRNVINVQPDQDRRTRTGMLLGRETVKEMLEIDHEENNIRISGFAARPGLTRSSRKDQRMFVNSRPVNNDTINYAIRDAYDTLVVKGRFPPVLLFVEVPPETIDVNVHPSKREIRFHNARTVSSSVANAIRHALQVGIKVPQTKYQPVLAGNKGDSEPEFPRADFSASPEFTEARFQSELPEIKIIDRHSSPAAPEPEASSGQAGAISAASESGMTEAPEPAATSKVAGQEGGIPAVQPGEVNKDISDLKVIGQLSENYIIAEGESGLVVLDKKAAHQRILFEALLHNQKSEGQGLLIPVTLELSPSETAILSQNLNYFCDLGFEIENFGNDSYIIQSVPANFPQENIIGLIHDILDELSEGLKGRKRSDIHNLAISASKVAVHSSYKLHDMEVDELLDSLASCEMPYTCPIGRPTIINFSYSELDKRFGKKY